MARAKLPKATRDVRGRITSVFSDIKENPTTNGMTVFDNTVGGRGSKNVKYSDRNVGGLEYDNRDGNARRLGHNYTTKDGQKVSEAGGSLTRRQQYYDVRKSMGLVGG